MHLYNPVNSPKCRMPHATCLQEEPIYEIMGNLLELDLMIVPVSQVRPKDGSVTMNAWVDVALTKEEKQKQDIDAINAIDLSKYSSEALGKVKDDARENREKIMNN